MDQIMCSLKWLIYLVYLDDVLVFARSFDELLNRLDTVLSAIEKAGLLLQPKKCVFGTNKIVHLGFVISSEGKKSRCVHSGP